MYRKPLMFIAGSWFAVAGLASAPTGFASSPASYSSAADGQRAGNPPSHSFQALPSALRPIVYQTLAKDAGRSYRVEGGCATSLHSSLKACFDSRGARFGLSGVHSSGSGTVPLALHLLSYGRGAHFVSLSPVHPEIEANQVRYDHGNLTEWWRVLPMGFEQGFTLTERPGGAGELTLTLAASGKADYRHGALAWGRLRYGNLVVTDANDKVIPATLTSKGDRVLIAVNDARAAYPLTVDPLVWLEQKVSDDEGVAGDYYGYSVALDGKIAIVGALFAINGSQGAAYIFRESNGRWAQVAKLTPDDGSFFNYFGNSVAINDTTALVGAPYASVDGHVTGAVYVFTYVDGSWSQTQKLTASDGADSDNFGRSVAMDGTTVLIGASLAAVEGRLGQGAAYIFNYTGGTWNETQKLVASDGDENNYFGEAVALAGNAAVIGARGATINGNVNQGAAYVFSESNGAWAQTAKLTASDGVANEYFSESAVAIEGSTAFVGAPEATVNDNPWQGAAYVFSDAGGAWVQTQKITASDGAENDQFGHSVTIDGDTALVGAPYGTQGAVYVFTDDGTWNQTRKLIASDGSESDFFGFASALSGTQALVGAFGEVGGASQGAAYFYGASDLGLAVSAPQTVGQGQQYLSQTIATNGSNAASPAVSATITVPAAASFVSATASQGTCSETSGVVTCDFGQINGNAGTATANVTLKAIGDVGDTIENVAGIAKATPPLSASAATTITAGGACPDGYAEYDGTLNPGELARSPVYQAPGGSENAILTAPERFQLYAVYQSGRYGRHVYLVSGNEVHRWGQKGLYMWLVRARDGAGAYTLCLQHP